MTAQPAPPPAPPKCSGEVTYGLNVSKPLVNQSFVIYVESHEVSPQDTFFVEGPAFAGGVNCSGQPAFELLGSKEHLDTNRPPPGPGQGSGAGDGTASGNETAPSGSGISSPSPPPTAPPGGVRPDRVAAAQGVPDGTTSVILLYRGRPGLPPVADPRPLAVTTRPVMRSKEAGLGGAPRSG